MQTQIQNQLMAAPKSVVLALQFNHKTKNWVTKVNPSSIKVIHSMTSLIAGKAALDKITEDGSLKEGDQFVLILEAPGTRQLEGVTHAVNLYDGMFSLDLLIPYLDKLVAKKVKVGIIDLSSNSVPSLKLADITAQHKEHICVMTADGVNESNADEFASSLSAASGSGRTMEEVFQTARSSDQSLSSPVLSDEAAMACNDALAEVNAFRAGSNFWNFNKYAVNEDDGDLGLVANLEKNLGSLMKLEADDKDILELGKHISQTMNAYRALDDKYPKVERRSDKKKSFENGMSFMWGDSYDVLFAPNSWFMLWRYSFEAKLHMQSSVTKEQREEILAAIDPKVSDRKFDKVMDQYSGEVREVLESELANVRAQKEMFEFYVRHLPNKLKRMDKEELIAMTLAGMDQKRASTAAERRLFNRCYQALKKPAKSSCQSIKL